MHFPEIRQKEKNHTNQAKCYRLLRRTTKQTQATNRFMKQSCCTLNSIVWFSGIRGAVQYRPLPVLSLSRCLCVSGSRCAQLVCVQLHSSAYAVIQFDQFEIVISGFLMNVKEKPSMTFDNYISVYGYQMLYNLLISMFFG